MCVWTVGETREPREMKTYASAVRKRLRVQFSHCEVTVIWTNTPCLPGLIPSVQKQSSIASFFLNRNTILTSNCGHIFSLFFLSLQKVVFSWCQIKSSKCNYWTKNFIFVKNEDKICSYADAISAAGFTFWASTVRVNLPFCSIFS